ncbi:MAG TPA: ATP-binding protein, partial [Abditibacterium sp.]
TIAALPFLLIIAFGVIRFGLAPLRSIAAAIESRAGSDLSPVPASPYRELSPLIDAINRLMARLSKRVEHEHEFLSDAAHELKTPLAAIQLNAHLLCARLDRLEQPGRAHESGQGLRDGVARATHVVHQLLALERIEAGVQVEPLALDALVRDRLAPAATLALARGIEIEFESSQPCVLPLHRESMAALLDNLIGNAVKYSPPDALVTVTLALDGAGTTLTVRDRGPGIAPALRAKVFDRFYRIPGNDQPGSGLGLAIAERAAARNGAAITLQSPADAIGLAVQVSWRAPR